MPVWSYDAYRARFRKSWKIARVRITKTWWQFLEGIDPVVMDTGVSDLAERHDHYLGAL